MPGGESRDERLALNQALFRDVNARIQNLVLTFEDDSGVQSYACECADLGCSVRIDLTRGEYEALSAVYAAARSSFASVTRCGGSSRRSRIARLCRGAPVVASGAVRVEQVDFISIPTRDVRRAVAWYRDVLGLPESVVSEGEVETPNVTLSFWEPGREDLPFVPNTAGFAVRVADVAEARAELEAEGVEFIAETWDSGVCQFAACRDPDGNTVILHRRYAPRTAREQT
jgi:catechol 2,3-dioxygenase-like lactoylglutathione lyase family enzyme